LAQFGVVGILLFLLFWLFISGKAINLYKKSGYTQSKQIITILLVIGFLAIESTTGSTFIAQGGFFTLMLVGMILSDMQKEKVGTINKNNI
jgi:O-antigen ligase